MLQERVQQELLNNIIENAIELAFECLPVLQDNIDIERSAIITNKIIPWALELESELRLPTHNPDEKPYYDAVIEFANRKLAKEELSNTELRDYTIVPLG